MSVFRTPNLQKKIRARGTAARETSVSGESVRSDRRVIRVKEPVPERLGRFEILGVLGEGAFGVVYKARDPQLDRTVAVKVPKRAGGRQSVAMPFFSFAPRG